MLPKKKRKWEAFKGVLPAYIDPDPERVELISRIKTLLAGIGLQDLAKDYSLLKQKKEELEAELSILNLEIDARNELLAERLENQGLHSIKLASGENFYIQDEPYSSVENKDLVNQWFIGNGMDELRTVNWQTLNSIVKERLESGLREPAGVKVFMKKKIVMRKG